MSLIKSIRGIRDFCQFIFLIFSLIALIRSLGLSSQGLENAKKFLNLKNPCLI